MLHCRRRNLSGRAEKYLLNKDSISIIFSLKIKQFYAISDYDASCFYNILSLVFSNLKIDFVNGTESIKILDSGKSAAGWSCFCIEMKRSLLAFCGGGFCDPLQNFPIFVLLDAWAGLRGEHCSQNCEFESRAG